MRTAAIVAGSLVCGAILAAATNASAQAPRNATQPSGAARSPFTTLAPAPPVPPPSTGAPALTPEQIAPSGGQAANAGPKDATPFSGAPYDLDQTPSFNRTPDLSR